MISIQRVLLKNVIYRKIEKISSFKYLSLIRDVQKELNDPANKRPYKVYRYMNDQRNDLGRVSSLFVYMPKKTADIEPL